MVPSSREALDADSPWNQALRCELPQLFAAALQRFLALPPPGAAPPEGAQAANRGQETEAEGPAEMPGGGLAEGMRQQGVRRAPGRWHWLERWLAAVPLEGEATGFFAGLPLRWVAG